MIGAGMSVFFAGCQHRVAPVERGVDSIVINTTERLIQGDSLSPACDLRINLAYATPDDSINRLINEAVAHAAFDYTGVTLPAAADSFANSYIARYHKELEPFYQEEKRKGEVGEWYNYEYELRGSFIPARDSLQGYQLELICYEGGAHGSHTISYMNFVSSTGQLLTLDDVFAPGYQEPLTHILLTALEEKLGVKTLDELHENGFLTWTEMYPSKNFLLAPEGIRFYYNAYEIAPYAAGPTELTIPYEAVKDLEKK